MNDKTATCEKCGHLMIAKNDGVTRGMYCLHCGWNVVSTDLENVNFDTVAYALAIQKNQEPTVDRIKQLAALTGRSFLESRSVLLNGGKVFEGEAAEVLKFARSLMGANIKFDISPHFKWLDHDSENL